MEVESNPAGFTCCKTCSWDQLHTAIGGVLKARLRTGFFVGPFRIFSSHACPKAPNPCPRPRFNHPLPRRGGFSGRTADSCVPARKTRRSASGARRAAYVTVTAVGSSAAWDEICVLAIRGFCIGHSTNHFSRYNIKPESQAGLSIEFDHFSHYLLGC